MLASALSGVVIFCIVCSTLISIIQTVPETKPYHHVIGIFEAGFTFIFTVEILVRMWIAESCLDYWRRPSNIIDVVVTLPWYVDQLLYEVPTLKSMRSFRVIRMVRLLRVMRIAKSVRRSKLISVVFESLMEAWTGFIVLASMMGLLSTVCATLIYVAESDVPGTQFESIPMGMWWAIATVSTVGYGDLYPITFWGRLIGSMTMVLGVMVVAISTAIISNLFTEAFAKKTQGDARKASDDSYVRSVSLRGDEEGGSTAGSSGSESSEGDAARDAAQRVAELRRETSLLLSQLERAVLQMQSAGGGDGTQAEAAVYAQLMLQSCKEGSTAAFNAMSNLADRVMPLHKTAVR